MRPTSVTRYDLRLGRPGCAGEKRTMSMNLPWSVKGVSVEAREAAKVAARQTGQPIGGWLSEAILMTATHTLRRDPDDLDDLYPVKPRRREEVDMVTTTTTELEHDVREATSRLGRLEDDIDIHLRPLLQRIDRLTREVEAIATADRPPPPEPTEPINLVPLQRAIRHLEVRVAVLERDQSRGWLSRLLGRGRRDR